MIMNFIYQKTVWGKILDYVIMPFWWLLEVLIFWFVPVMFFSSLIGYGFWEFEKDATHIISASFATIIGVLVTRRLFFFWPDLFFPDKKIEGKVQDVFIRSMGAPQLKKRGGHCEVLVDEKSFDFYVKNADDLPLIGQYIEVEYSRFLDNVKSVKIIGREF